MGKYTLIMYYKNGTRREVERTSKMSILRKIRDFKKSENARSFTFEGCDNENSCDNGLIASEYIKR